MPARTQRVAAVKKAKGSLRIEYSPEINCREKTSVLRHSQSWRGPAGGLKSQAMSDSPPNAAPGKPLSPQARRALEEAAERHAAEAAAVKPAEVNGPKGPEPTRFGDWERKGIAVDF
jgi:hypothetical protein